MPDEFDVNTWNRVSYVLDGSVRKSGSRVRVAARLVRADNGYVIWSESYDRLFDDLSLFKMILRPK
jgi:TolB-like protein